MKSEIRKRVESAIASVGNGRQFNESTVVFSEQRKEFRRIKFCGLSLEETQMNKVQQILSDELNTTVEVGDTYSPNLHPAGKFYSGFFVRIYNEKKAEEI